MKQLALTLILSSIALVGCAGSNAPAPPVTGTKIGLWCTTGVKSGNLYVQRDRLANPAVNEVFGTVYLSRGFFFNRLSHLVNLSNTLRMLLMLSVAIPRQRALSLVPVGLA